MVQKEAIVIGGGKWQLPIIEFLKSKNYLVACINPFETDTTKHADFYFCADIKDYKSCLEIAKKLNPEIITSDMTDAATLTVSMLCKDLNLKGNDPDSVIKFYDKTKTYKHAERCGIKCPQKTNDYPCIIKPVDSNASCGFSVVRNKSEEDAAIRKALLFSKNFIKQEFIDGIGLTLDGFHCGVHKTLCAGTRTYFRDGVISGVYYTHFKESEMTKANDLFVNSSGLSFGITHAEYIVNENGFWLIDIAARGGGYRIGSDIIQWCSGFPVYEALYCCLADKPLPGWIKANRTAEIKFYEFDVVKELDFGNAFDYGYNVEIGSKAFPATNGKERHAFSIHLTNE